MFFNPFPDAFGLDIGDLSIKAVQLRKISGLFGKPHYNLVVYRSINMPPGLIVNGELQKPEEVRKYILKLLQGTRPHRPISSPWVVASLPETKSFVKLIQVKKNTSELIDDEIINIAKKHIPFDEDNYYLQWQMIPDTGPAAARTRILINATLKLMSDSYTYLLESMGLGVIALEIGEVALTRAMITAHKNYGREARAILDIGATRSSLIVYDNGVIQFSTSTPYSGELLTTAISQKMHISRDEAEELKKQTGLDYKKSNNMAWKIIAEMSEELINSVRNALNFYYSHFPEANRITRIILCGGGANLKLLDRVISAQLKTTARPGLPWKNLSTKKEVVVTREAALGYATAIGLALRAADNPFFTRHIL